QQAKPEVPPMMGQQQAPPAPEVKDVSDTKDIPEAKTIPETKMEGINTLVTDSQHTQELKEPYVPKEMPEPPVTPTSSTDEVETKMMGNLVGQLNSKPVPHLVRVKTGEIINITKPEFSIGKSESKADYTITDNSAVSRVHCIIIQKNGVNYIKDNNSTNHTYINGVEIEPDKEVLLKNKTTVRMGDEEFTFLLRKE
ncbi:MAG: FHA domain-containing protein, partial [Lachnospiraceae bacterium]|nr:FHA domain-containing protein [Lachnospiraceae bacterium]